MFSLTLSLSKVEDLSGDVGPNRTISIHFIVCICAEKVYPHQRITCYNKSCKLVTKHANTEAARTFAKSVFRITYNDYVVKSL